jgi:hypothetical protein
MKVDDWALAIARDYRWSVLRDRLWQGAAVSPGAGSPATFLKLFRLKSDIRNMRTHEEGPWERDRQRMGDARAKAIWEQRRAQLGLAQQPRGKAAYPARSNSSARRMTVIVVAGLTLSLVILLVGLATRPTDDSRGLAAVHRHSHEVERRDSHRLRAPARP